MIRLDKTRFKTPSRVYFLLIGKYNFNVSKPEKFLGETDEVHETNK